MQGPDLDPFTVAVAIAASLVGPVLAPYVGAYTLILIGWFVGVLIGVFRRDAGSRIGAAVFVVVTFGLTVGSTVYAAQMLAPRVGATANALLFPVAVLIPAIGDDWIKMAAWTIDQARMRLSRLWGNTQ